MSPHLMWTNRVNIFIWNPYTLCERFTIRDFLQTLVRGPPFFDHKIVRAPFFPKENWHQPQRKSYRLNFQKLHDFFRAPLSDIRNFKAPLLFASDPPYKCLWMVPYTHSKREVLSIFKQVVHTVTRLQTHTCSVQHLVVVSHLTPVGSWTTYVLGKSSPKNIVILVIHAIIINISRQNNMVVNIKVSWCLHTD